MLDYLVTSKARRRLLTLLWRQGASGSASALAQQAHVAFASVHRELQAMKLLGLVVSRRENAAEVFRANEASPFAQVLHELSRPVPSMLAADPAAVRTRGELRTLGAPLLDPPVDVSEVEAALVRGAALSHRDPTVARVLPLCFHRSVRDRHLDVDRLLRLARDSSEKQAVGFFLDLTGSLSGDRRLKRWASRFRDRRCAEGARSFFVESSPAAREAASQNTPAVARRWGLRMNMGLGAFKSMYEKHVDA
ncbi:MAG TPA: hypothetical protein VMB50_00890 [Myxococcales bacterium]|nr:hypothetical protein [Myxococcales bacterium]